MFDAANKARAYNRQVSGMESAESDSANKEALMNERALLLMNIGVVYKTIGEYEKAVSFSYVRVWITGLGY